MDYTTEELQEFHRRLLLTRWDANQARSGSRGWKAMGAGICDHADCLASGYGCDTYFMVNDLALGWPQHSGDMHGYPVPCPNGGPARDAYYVNWRTEQKWSGPYGDLRMSLLNYLIERVAKALGERA